jgi:hypothetical protein
MKNEEKKSVFKKEHLSEIIKDILINPQNHMLINNKNI